MAARKKSRASAPRAARRSSAGPKRKSSGAGAKRRSVVRGPGRKPAGKKVARAKRAPATRRAAAAKRTPAPRVPAAVVGAIGLRVQHMDYTTHALDEVRRFYTEVLGFTSFTFDPEMSYLAVNTGPSSSIGFMPPMAVPPEQWQPPREPTIYLIVADVDRAHRDLVAKGAEFERPPADMPWGHRVAALRDPEGRMVCLAQIRAGA